MQLTTSDLLARGTALLARVLERPNLDAGDPAGIQPRHPARAAQVAPEEPRGVPDLERYLALIERRAQGEPLAYITGRREFWTLELRVTPDVLVPRPETELLVERGLALCHVERAQVLDLGTGLGGHRPGARGRAARLVRAGDRCVIRGIGGRAGQRAAPRPGCGRIRGRQLVLAAGADGNSTWLSAIRPMWMPAIRCCRPSRMSRARP